MDADKIKEILMKVKKGEWDWEEASEALGSEKDPAKAKGKSKAKRSDAKSGDSAAKAGGSAESGDGPKNSTKAKGSAKNKDTEEKAKAGAQNQKKASTVKESDSKGTKDQGSQQRPKSGPGQGDQSERFQQDLGEFFKGMEEVGKTLAKGIESTVNEIQRNLGLGAMPNPFGVPREVAFFYYKKEGDEERKPIWNVKIPLQFFMAFRGLLEQNPQIFGDPPPFDFVKIYQELDNLQEGSLWSMEKNDTGESWEVKLQIKSN